MKTTLNKQGGFTLMEIAVVLTIVGLLMAAVVKGSAFIQESKFQNAKNAIDGYKTAFSAYQKRYNAIPGDDDGASSHNPASDWAGTATGGTTTGAATNGDGSGLIDSTAEETAAFDHMARAKLIKYFDGIGTKYPKHSLGGNIKLLSNTAGFTHAVCLDGLSKDDAIRLDEIVDGGLTPNAGDARILDNNGGLAANAAAISDTGNTLCVAL